MEAEKAKSKKQIELQKQRKQKKPVVVKVKRKRDETPDEALVIESRISKKTKVNFLDSFKKLNLCDGPTNQDTYTTTSIASSRSSVLIFRKIFPLFWNRKQHQLRCHCKDQGSKRNRTQSGSASGIFDETGILAFASLMAFLNCS